MDSDGCLTNPKRLLLRRFSRVLLLGVILAVVGGCAAQKFVSLRDNPMNPLAAQLNLVSKTGPQVSARTETLLHHYALQDLYKREPDACLMQLQDLAVSEKGAEKVYAVSELAYILGVRAEKSKNMSKALDMYSVAVSNAYIYLFCSELDYARNPYDPQFRGACDVYNSALEATLRLVNRRGGLKPGNTYRIETAERKYGVRVMATGSWHDEDFERFEFCNDYKVEGLDTTNVGYGIGVPLIAVRKKHDASEATEGYYPEGLSFPVTAVLRVTSPSVRPQNSSSHRYPCVLELHDPLVATDIRLVDRRVPLQSDLSTPLGFFLDNPQFREQTNGTLGLINPNKVENLRGIYMLEPYDPHRIPVVMVHGLWSSPLTWMPMFNDLRSFEELRQNYQFWFYQYPTGQPFWISATQMRSDLADLRMRIDPGRQHTSMDHMVLVGHSMGGLVSRMQTLQSGDEFWRVLSDKPFSEVKGSEQEVKSLQEALFFEPNPSIRRVVTIGTPHRGSEFANDATRWLSRKVIKLPQSITDAGNSIVRQNPGVFRDTEMLTVTTSIDSLSPQSPIFPAMLRAARAPWVRYNNIVGVKSDSSVFNRLHSPGDGIVDINSAHLDDVPDEIVVESAHQDIHRKPRAILEVRRILQEHLESLIQEHRLATQPAENYLLGKVGRSKSRVVPAASFQPPKISGASQSEALAILGIPTDHSPKQLPLSSSQQASNAAPVVSATTTSNMTADERFQSVHFEEDFVKEAKAQSAKRD
jgi:pimeloyl-ACP methyl ester carboxylesterase